jgi:tRNA-dihydrouridine synthase
MIARWAQGRPWIFEPMRDGGFPTEPVSPPTIERLVELILEQYRLMAERFGEKLAVLRMRKHVGWFTHGWPGGSHLRSEIMTISSLPRAIERLHAYLDNLDTNFAPEGERAFPVALEDDEEPD